MKYLIAFILLLTSCRAEQDKKVTVIVKQGVGWGTTTHYLYCDSAIQINKNQAVMWLDGDSLNVYGDAIMIEYN